LNRDNLFSSEQFKIKIPEKEESMKKFSLLFIIVLLAASGFVWAGGDQEPADEMAPAAEMKRELRATFAWPTYIDPAVGSDFSSSSAFVNLYDTLVYPTADGDVIPHLAESWDASADGLTWTFKLRKGVKFHDGSELIADDVVFSMDRLIAIGEGYGYLYAGRIKESKALDDYTVQFSMNAPYGPFLTTLVKLYILNDDQVMANKKDGPYGANGDYGKEYLLTNDCGSGPYTVKEMRLEEHLLMERFDGYWGDFVANAPDEVKFIGTTEAITVRTMMARGELEISDQWQSLEALKSLDNTDGVDIATMYLGTIFYYMVHTQKAPTDDIHFRKAMAWAFDYKTITEDLFPGARVPQGPIAPGFMGHDTDFTIYTRDLAKAKAELAKSKYADKLDEYPVELHWIAEVPDEEKAALLFMSNMQDIGINVEIVKVPWMSVVEEMSNIDSSPNIVTIFVSPHYAEAGSILEARYHSNSAATWQQNEWLLDSNIDMMIESSLATIDREERAQAYRDLQQKLDELAPSLYLFEQAQKHAYQSYIDWPAAMGESIPVMGYDFAARFIQVHPEKK
jgi:peptide/nickel transport system substrate-binding protein